MSFAVRELELQIRAKNLEILANLHVSSLLDLNSVCSTTHRRESERKISDINSLLSSIFSIIHQIRSRAAELKLI
jgi:hypothetical protein